jgi:STAS-like domain of unknown function (DUF4325)
LSTKHSNPQETVAPDAVSANPGRRHQPLQVREEQIQVLAATAPEIESAIPQGTVVRDRGRLLPSSDTIVFPPDFNITCLRQFVAAIYRAYHQLGYKDLFLDFSACERADPAPMVGLIAYCRGLRRAGIDVIPTLPESPYLRRLFLNSNWAHSLSPSEHPASDFRARTQVPVLTFSNADEQKVVVDRLIDCILSCVNGYSREHLKAIEWSVNEITDNVLMHSNCPDGGVLQLTSKQKAKLIEFVVADAGDGIPKSLKSSRLNISSDVEALSRAIEQGVTRDEAIGQGNGLWGSYRIALKSSGKFDIHSGYATLYYTANAGMHTRPEQIPYTGTLVHCCVNYGTRLILDDILGLGRKFDPTDRVELLYEVNSEDTIPFKLKDEAESLGSRLAGKKVRTKLHNFASCSGCRIDVDFSGVNLLSSSFADEVFGKLFLQLGPIDFGQRILLSKVPSTVKLLVDKAISQRVAFGKFD